MKRSKEEIIALLEKVKEGGRDFAYREKRGYDQAISDVSKAFGVKEYFDTTNSTNKRILSRIQSKEAELRFERTKNDGLSDDYLEGCFHALKYVKGLLE